MPSTIAILPFHSSLISIPIKAGIFIVLARIAVWELEEPSLAMMLEDDDYNDSVYNIIRNDEVNAEFAVATTGDNFSVMFAEMEDELARIAVWELEEPSLVTNASSLDLSI